MVVPSGAVPAGLTTMRAQLREWLDTARCRLSTEDYERFQRELRNMAKTSTAERSLENLFVLLRHADFPEGSDVHARWVSRFADVVPPSLKKRWRTLADEGEAAVESPVCSPFEAQGQTSSRDPSLEKARVGFASPCEVVRRTHVLDKPPARQMEHTDCTASLDVDGALGREVLDRSASLLLCDAALGAERLDELGTLSAEAEKTDIGAVAPVVPLISCAETSETMHRPTFGRRGDPHDDPSRRLRVEWGAVRSRGCKRIATGTVKTAFVLERGVTSQSLGAAPAMGADAIGTRDASEVSSMVQSEKSTRDVSKVSRSLCAVGTDATTLSGVLEVPSKVIADILKPPREVSTVVLSSGSPDAHEVGDSDSVQSPSDSERVWTCGSASADACLSSQVPAEQSQAPTPKQPVCVVCREPPLTPQVAFCGHFACAGCWALWVAERQECPVCRKKVRTTNLITLKGWGDV